MKWKPIKATGGRYLCNRLGQIKGTDRVVDFGISKRLAKGKVMSPKIKSNGYCEVSLSIAPQKSKSFYVHRLIAETWLGDIPEKMTVNHKDGDKKNNHTDNLEIVTYSQNSKHAYGLGLKKPRVFTGSAHPMSKTNEEEVLKIRKEHRKHKSIVQLLKDYPHLTKPILTKIVYRASWKHV